MWGRIDGLRTLDLGTPGDMRTQLNDLVLSGAKTGTASLLEHDYRAENEELEHVGERLVLVDDNDGRLAEVEVTAVEVVPFKAVTWKFAESEGEGFRSVEHWGEAHRRFWANAGYEVDDTTEIVCVNFRLVGSGPF
ncbi:ASCH domain-containing protein [Nonomuraea sp. NPDC059194]|uniref:ASCH domain-containing protein n=1 Tax=Nonomuraea sp. NPDC059194 TaxID=3346764 RepID=UPI00369A5068